MSSRGVRVRAVLVAGAVVVAGVEVGLSLVSILERRDLSN
jgi:hypothetical protein